LRDEYFEQGKTLRQYLETAQFYFKFSFYAKWIHLILSNCQVLSSRYVRLILKLLALTIKFFLMNSH